jgi:hypothetical protein
VVVLPLQIVLLNPTVMSGKGFTKTIIESIAVPQELVTARVYVVVIAGLATGFEMVGLLNPVIGVQAYVPFPDPFSVVLSPLHMVTSNPALAVGKGFTVTLIVSLLLPQELVRETE